jgi:uncharacterized protein with PQ loop repeat
MLGWLGSIMLAFCGLPQAIKTLKDGHSKGLDAFFLLLWTFGEIFTLIAICNTAPNLLYLLFNYGLNIVFLSVIWYYRFFPRYLKPGEINSEY